MVECMLNRAAHPPLKILAMSECEAGAYPILLLCPVLISFWLGCDTVSTRPLGRSISQLAN